MRIDPNSQKRSGDNPSYERGIDRRSLLVGGGLGAGLLIAWGVWPRQYKPNLPVASNELMFNAFLKVDTSGQVIVVVPQLEMGQGVTTVLPQILADELGADWRTVAVQSAPVNPLYANSLLVQQWLDDGWLEWTGKAGEWSLREYATRDAMMLTAGATALPMYERAFREAGAAARVLLCKAAAARWDVPWESCDIVGGFVSDGQNKARLGELAADAVSFTLPKYLPERQGSDNRLIGQSVPRLDLPSKLDGSHNYAADIRLPGMLFASIRQGPVGAIRLKSMREGEARKVPGFVRVEKGEDWVAALGSNWWAANRALDALDPVFEVAGPLLSSAAIETALIRALDNGDAAKRIHETGNIETAMQGAELLKAEYSVAPALHLAVEPPCATARVSDGRAEVWCATQAQSFCRAAIAEALDMAAEDVILYPVSSGGSFDRRLDHDAAVQAAILAQRTGRPVQLLWSRLEETIHDRPRPPARARLAANLARGGMIEGWSAQVAAPSALRETWARIAHGTPAREAMEQAAKPSRHAVAGMELPYAVPNIAIDHHPAEIGLPCGSWRGAANSYGAFFTESFIDELAAQAQIEPMSFRIQMLGGQARLAHCLTTVAAMGGWQGGIAGSGQGLACHMMDGAYIAVLAEVTFEEDRIMAQRIIAAVDCGDQPHPDIALQQIEGGLIFGLAAAMGCAAEYRGGLPRRAIMGRMGLPILADIGEVSVELIESRAPAVGVEQIGVPAVAPAVANALYTLAGRRFRRLPLVEMK